MIRSSRAGPWFRPVLALALLGGCASTAAPNTQGAANGNDCAVIAAVAREHYRFDADSAPPPLWLDGEGSDWAPRCDWSRYGLAFPAVHDPDRPHAPSERIQWVQFKRPRYDGQGALIEAGVLHGPLAGSGVECRVRSGVAGWTVSECHNTWIS